MKVLKTILAWIIFLLTFLGFIVLIGSWTGSAWQWSDVAPFLAISISSLTLIYILKKHL